MHVTTSVRPKLRPEIKAQWLAALRSGDYEQGTQYLHRKFDSGQEKFCCLGVLCDLAAKAGVVSAAGTNEEGLFVRFLYGGSATMPPTSVVEWAFDEPDMPWAFAWHVPHPDPEGNQREDSLDALNDEHGMGFDQIAALIEEHL